MASQAQPAEANVPQGSNENLKSTLANLNQKMMSCRSKSLIDQMKEKDNTLNSVFSGNLNRAILAGTDGCPGTNVPAGSSFIDAGSTVGANDTVKQLNACIPFPTEAGPDMVYKIVLQAPATRPTCQISVTPQASYDTGVYLLGLSGPGCPNGTGNTVTNCVIGKDGGFAGTTETITTAQMNTVPAGTYFLFVDSFYCGPDGSFCNGASGANECPSGNAVCFRGTYTLNVSNCATLAPTAALVGVSGRVVTADGRGISKATITAVLPSGESRSVISNPFGFYHFDDIEVGNAYVFQVTHKQHEFPNGSQLVTVNDTVENLDFVAAGSTRPRNTKN